MSPGSVPAPWFGLDESRIRKEVKGMIARQTVGAHGALLRKNLQ